MSEQSAAVCGLRIGAVRGVTLTKWRRVWGERFEAPLSVREVPDEEQLAGLRDGSLDMCFVRLPIDREGLHAIPLYEERIVAWVSKEHAISAVDEVTLADLDDEQVLTEPTGTATDLVLGGAVLVVPMSVARGASRRDLTYRPVVDADPSPVALAWRTEDENPLIEEFIGVVRGRTPNSSRTARARAPESRTPAEPRQPGRRSPARSRKRRR
ncbi:LysR family substrate-binding domain-containing protein [Piscicoccus intestinalis]|uniref:LysR family substrate-binding domain-containing protein n=1 Tax=Piscicoccus intestinalis TaxID=746033 RepID=UPI0008388126|nr:LysR family substrate-binding domain-containing protein [Piscicoccus intestinalis]